LLWRWKISKSTKGKPESHHYFKHFISAIIVCPEIKFQPMTHLYKPNAPGRDLTAVVVAPGAQYTSLP
jgi:hypothetical protein